MQATVATEETTAPFWVFVRGHQHVVLSDQQATFEAQQRLDKLCFTMVWDSAPESFEGAAYAAKYYGAYVPANWFNRGP